MNTTASSARSRSASSNTITGFLPPSSKCTRFKVGAPCAMMAEPVALSPTKPIALIAGCSVSALPASSPKPCTVLSTPSGTPASLTILVKRSAVTGDHSAGLCTTVQPAASAGAIFQVESMNGVFHGVITPTGPIGTRVETFQCSSLGVLRPSLASAHLSAKKRKFSAARIAALAMKRWACPVSMHSSTAISSARASIASATRCNSFRRMLAAMSRHAGKASAAMVAARSTSSALPRATFASTLPSTGDLVSNVAPEIDGTVWPSIMCPMPSSFSFASRGAARSRLALNRSALGVALSMDRLRFQSFVNVVALPTGLFAVDLHVERQCEFALREHRIEMLRQRTENVLAGGLARCEVAAFAEPQHHVEKAVIEPAISDRIVLAADGADADAAEREDAGLDRGLAHDLDDLAHVEARVEIGGILDREMRHGEITPRLISSEVAAHGSIRTIVGLDRVTLAGLDRADEGPREHDLARFQRKSQRRDLVGEPRDGRGGMIEHAGGEPGLFQLAIAIAERTDPAQVGIERPQRPSAEHDAGVRSIVRDGVEDLSRGFCLGVDALDSRVENFERRHHELGGIEHVEQGAIRPGQPLAHDEGKLGFDARGDEAVARHEPAIGKEHVVEQHAGIRLVDIERALHRLRGQADLVSLDQAALGAFDLDPGLLDRIGVGNRDGRTFLRQLPDLRARLLRLVKALGRASDLVAREGHGQDGVCSAKRDAGRCLTC